METYLVKLNGRPWFRMTVLPYRSVPALAREVAMGGMPDAVVSVEWCI